MKQKEFDAFCAYLNEERKRKVQGIRDAHRKNQTAADALCGIVTEKTKGIKKALLDRVEIEKSPQTEKRVLHEFHRFLKKAIVGFKPRHDVDLDFQAPNIYIEQTANGFSITMRIPRHLPF